MAKALDFAAAATNDAWRHELAVVLEPWLRRRLDQLLRVPDVEEGLGSLEARVRHAVILTHRYRLTRYELFGDRHWTGRPEAPWWCPDHDLAARSPFDGYAEGDEPAYALILDDPSAPHRAGELTVVAHSEAPRGHRFDIIDGELRMRDKADTITRLAAHAALTALGVLPARS